MAGRHLCSPAPLFEDDDLLAEILVRLPALPPSLPGAMLVCTRWRSLVSDPGFRRRFLQRNPALLERQWNYIDPQGVAQGTFAIYQLRRWQNAGYFAKDFTVWRKDQTMNQAILLVQAARMIDYLKAPAPPSENDDLLAEILIRLPALPPSLPCAMLVCTRWRSVVSDPGFRRRFLERKPALLETPWHYIDPQGAVQGPFAMYQLWRWQNAGYFAKDFRVWRTDQTMDQAILLVQIAEMINYLPFGREIEIISLD